MANYQSEVYECARNTASIKIDDANTEWINEFSSGIKLNKGDNVRILGSFVHEGSSGEEIEVAADSSVNISYSPYIIGLTMGTADPDTNLLDLGQYGDIPFGTDAFGIEPPFRNDVNQQAATAVPSYQYPVNDQEAYAKPLSTGTAIGPLDPVTNTRNGQEFGANGTKWNCNGEPAINFGTNLITSKFDATLKTDNQVNLNNYNNFSERAIPNEMYVAQMVKKFILPMVKGHFNENGATGAATPEIHDWEDLIDNPVDGQLGMFSGVPKPGMCISTVDIGAGSGYYNDEGNAFFESKWAPDAAAVGTSTYNGLMNLKGGCQSMIGTIIAVRPIKHFINGNVVGCFEIYATDWVNPALLVQNGMLTHNFPINNLTEERLATGTNANVSDAGLYHKRVHGHGELPTNYNNNPSFNNINGGFNQMDLLGNYPGMTSGTPSFAGYNSNGYGKDKLVGGASNIPTIFQQGLAQPMGLSFPWNGSHCGGMRTEFAAGTNPLDNVYVSYRSNSVMFWRKGDPVAYPGQLTTENYSNSYITNTVYNGTTPLFAADPNKDSNTTPVCLGGYLICNRDTMLKVARGEYDITTRPDYWSAQANKFPRVWFDYAYQMKSSPYETRHLVNNVWNQVGTAAPGPPPTYPVRPVPMVLTERSTRDNRFGYAMCGQPLNINWRQSQASDGIENDSKMVLEYDFTQTDYPGGMGSCNSFTTVGDGMPRYWSSELGTKSWSSGEVNAERLGEPVVWGGYNTTINSIHFQQKETGDANLGATSSQATGRTHDLTLAYNGGPLPNLDTVNITKASLFDTTTGALFVPAIGDYIKILHDFEGKAAHQVDAIEIAAVTNNIGDDFFILILNSTFGTNTPSWRIMIDVPIFTQVTISRGPSNMPSGVGPTAKPWSTDCLIIKESLVKVDVPTGFYTEEQLSEHINDQLHLSPNKFKKDYGIKLPNGDYSIPSTVGMKEKSLTSQPSIVNGNFVHTYTPDVTFGFTPVVAENTSELNLDASTKLFTDELFNYDTLRDGDNNLIFYYSEQLETFRPYNGTTVRKLNEGNTQLGKHFKVYSVPNLTSSGTFNPQIHLMRLTGGALNIADYAAPSASGIAVWANLIPRWAGSYEMLRDSGGNRATPDTIPSSLGIYNYRTRLTRNLLTFGGGAKIFCGANNITFSWETGANRYSLNNMYTPIRPHERDDPNNTNQDFGIGDAVPSAIINAKYTGQNIGILSGIYINDLNAGAFTEENWGQPTIGDNYTYDTEPNVTILALGQSFLDILGFSAKQVSNNSNDFEKNINPFVFAGELENSGNVIRVGPKITTSVNGSNPFASNCLNVAPVIQFFVEVDTDDFFAANVPLKGIDPYYFIGSDFPTKKFYGNLSGDKLPVIGICARNFHAFNFVFDLGGSSISYTIEEDITIQSIRTKIFTSKLGSPTQLSPYSSIIYLITRNNASSTKSIPMPLAQVAQNIMTQNAQPDPNLIGSFYNPPLADIRFGQSNLPQPPQFYQSDVPPPPPIEYDTEDDDL